MFGKIVYISNNIAHIAKNPNMNASNLMNMHIVLEDNNKKILSEVDDISEDLIKVRFLGEFVNGKFVGGVIRKPSTDAKLRLITSDELQIIVGSNKSAETVEE